MLEGIDWRIRSGPGDLTWPDDQFYRSFLLQLFLRCACIESREERARPCSSISPRRAMILAEPMPGRQAEAVVSAAKLQIPEAALKARASVRSARERGSACSTSWSCSSRSSRRPRPRTSWRPSGAADGHDGAALHPQRPARKPFPEHLPRERVVVPAPDGLPLLRSARLAKLGEDVTETLEVVPRQWKVIQTVREKFTCRDCETISQPPAPFHVMPRGWAGPSLLAMILFEKYGQHQPLNRQSERYAREGVELSLSTLADQVGACAGPAAALRADPRPCVRRRAAAWRRHDRCRCWPRARPMTGRMWTYVRDDRPFGGRRRRRRCSSTRRDRRGEHPERHLDELCRHPAGRRLCRLQPALRAGARGRADHRSACWAHARRKFFELADLARSARQGAASSHRSRSRRCGGSTRSSPSSATINGRPAAERLAVRQRAQRSAGRRARGLDAARARPGCRAMPTSPRPWTTCSSAGPPSPASSTTAGSA